MQTYQISDDALQKATSALNTAIGIASIYAPSVHAQLLDAAHALDAINESPNRGQRLSDALRRLLQAVNRLGERDGDRTYFEHDVTKNGEAQKRWKELNDAGAQASYALAD